ncbi:MAG: hypothetical protein GX442_12505 [Candidatus Riflebacteria bacterium]|nr:hypothetical protein [Candidatus Riflebacteria bacterium]
MRRFGLAMALAILMSVTLGGCTERAPSPPPAASIPPPPIRSSEAIPAQPAPTVQPAAPASGSAANALEQAHQAYQKAYEQYVRLLRESGPQTMETLNALADYQKKYQIYQMLVGAERDIPGLATSSR